MHEENHRNHFNSNRHCNHNAINPLLKVKGKMSVSITGGADGPTSIFLAGKIEGASTVIGIILGIVLLTAGIFMIAKKK